MALVKGMHRRGSKLDQGWPYFVCSGIKNTSKHLGRQKISSKSISGYKFTCKSGQVVSALLFNLVRGRGFENGHSHMHLQFEKMLSFVHVPLLLVRSNSSPFIHCCKCNFAFISVRFRQDRCRITSYLYGTVTLS